MKKWLIIIRLLLSAAMLAFVYRETGPITVAAFALIVAGAECQTAANREVLDMIGSLMSMVKKLHEQTGGAKK